MRKSLIAIAAFIVSAILGSMLLLGITVAVGYIKIAAYQRDRFSQSESPDLVLACVWIPAAGNVG